MATSLLDRPCCVASAITAVAASRPATWPMRAMPGARCCGRRSPRWPGCIPTTARTDDHAAAGAGVSRQAWRSGARRRLRRRAVLSCRRPCALRPGRAPGRHPARVGYRRRPAAPASCSRARVADRRGALHYTEELGLLCRAWARAQTGLRVADTPVARRPRCPADRDAGVPVRDPARPLWAGRRAPPTARPRPGRAPGRPNSSTALLARGATSGVVLLGDAAARRLPARAWPGRITSGRTRLGEAPGCRRSRGAHRPGRGRSRISRRAEVFVGNDSGLMHLAAALGVPTVGIFGSIEPRLDRAPRRR